MIWSICLLKFRGWSNDLVVVCSWAVWRGFLFQNKEKLGFTHWVCKCTTPSRCHILLLPVILVMDYQIRWTVLLRSWPPSLHMGSLLEIKVWLYFRSGVASCSSKILIDDTTESDTVAEVKNTLERERFCLQLESYSNLNFLSILEYGDFKTQCQATGLWHKATWYCTAKEVPRLWLL